MSGFIHCYAECQYAKCRGTSHLLLILSVVVLIVIYAECTNEDTYAECSYGECLVLFIVILNVTMPGVMVLDTCC